jgi:hypothetical protein
MKACELILNRDESGEFAGTTIESRRCTIAKPAIT